MPAPLKTCVIYARTSREDEDKEDRERKLSIEIQIEQCRSLAAANGLEVLGVFEEPNRSGRLWPDVPLAANDLITIERYGANRRQRLTEVVGLIESRRLGYVVCYSPERFARPMTGLFSGYLEQLLTVNHVCLWTVTGGQQDLRDYTQGLINVISQRTVSSELEKNRLASLAAKKQKRDAGYVVCSPCLGYRSSGKQTVLVEPAEAETVKLIFDLYVKQDYGLYRLANELTRRGLKPKRSGKWFQNSLLHILRNPSYIGKAYDSARNLIDSKVYPAIITPEQFFAAQGVTRQWQKIPKRARRYKNEYTLTGTVLYCGACQGRLAAKMSHTHWVRGDGQESRQEVPYYVCQNDFKCPAKGVVKVADISALIRESVHDGTLAWLVRLVKHMEPVLQSRARASGVESIATVERGLAELAAQRQLYIDEYSNQPRTLMPLLAKLHQRDAELQERLKLEVGQLPVNLTDADDIDTPAGLRKFVLAMFRRIVVHRRDRIVLEFRERFSDCPASVTIQAKRGDRRKVWYHPLTPEEKAELGRPNAILCPPPAITTSVVKT